MRDDFEVSGNSGPGGVRPPGPSAVDVPVPVELADATRALFGDRQPLAAAYAELLAGDGVLRGLIGPRETPRLWDRHLLNCAAVAELIPAGRRVLDVGSGAGLPGLVLAIARPDLSVVLIEPLARRTAFLTEAVETLGLTNSVTVVRARAEEYAAASSSPAPGGTARAAAPSDRLAGWCLPLAAVGGRLLALKGSSAADEVVEHRDAVRELGGGSPVVHRCGRGLIDPPTIVVEIVRERAAGRQPSRRPRTGRPRRR
ncbi:16S rRNA (guanine(527)-N(7))-methyltransferase RsmG [Micromonospora zhanjiangensis]